MAASGGLFNPFGLGALRNAVNNTTKILREKLTAVTRPSGAELQAAPAPVRPSGSRGQPIHPNAVFRQQRRLFSGWSQANLNTAVRRFLCTLSDKQAAQGPRFDRSKFPVSKTSRLVAAFPGRAPFAHTLRPNLTGGALPRSAGGYGITGGGARYFSHSPAAPAQVVQNVSQAMRAFFLSGQRVRFDGLDEHGQRKYRAVSVLEDEASRKMAAVPRSHPGSFIDFHLSPTITAMSPLAAAFPFPASTETSDPEFYPTVYGYAAQAQKKQLIAGASPTTLNTAGFLEELSIDFARALKDLTVTLQDIRRLSTLGDLSIELVPDANVPTLRVRFPGVDAETVESLCDDVGVTRGIVGQDADFDASAGVPVALRFPFAPGCDGETKSLTSPGGSLRSLEGHELEEDFSDIDEAEVVFMIDELTEGELAQENPWLSSPEPGYGTMSPCSLHSGDSFEGLEGIYRFIEECDRARDQLR